MLNVMVGCYFNVSITFPNVSLMYPIVLILIMGFYICISFCDCLWQRIVSAEQAMVSNCVCYSQK